MAAVRPAAKEAVLQAREPDGQLGSEPRAAARRDCRRVCAQREVDALRLAARRLAALRRHSLVCKEDHHLRLNGFLLGLSILRII